MLADVCLDAPIVSVTSADVSLVASEPLIVTQNSTLTLLCHVDANPSVDWRDVVWYKDVAVIGPST